jgi:hypothetical protein
MSVDTSSSSSSTSSSFSSIFDSHAAVQDAAVSALEYAVTAAAASGLRLQHFSSNYLYHPSFLQSLPASLQELDLSRLLNDPSHPTNTPQFTAALARFTALETLSLGRTDKYLSHNISINPIPNPPAGGLGVTSSSSSSLNPDLLQAVRALPSLSALLLQGAVLAAADAQQLPAGVTRWAAVGLGWMPVTNFSRFTSGAPKSACSRQPAHAALVAIPMGPPPAVTCHDMA